MPVALSTKISARLSRSFSGPKLRWHRIPNAMELVSVVSDLQVERQQKYFDERERIFRFRATVLSKFLVNRTA
jgi:hypothetical protein